MEPKTSSFTINLPDTTTTNNDKVETKTDKSLEYIIQKNEKLDDQNKELTIEIQVLKAKLEEEEGINDNNDLKLNNMRSVTKNVVEAKIIAENIKNEYTLINYNHEELIKLSNKNYTEFITMLNNYLLMHIILFIIYTLYYSTYCMLLLSIFIYMYVYNEISNKKKEYTIIEKSTNNEINIIKAKIAKLNLELTKLKNATDYLHDYIDSI